MNGGPVLLALGGLSGFLGLCLMGPTDAWIAGFDWDEMMMFAMGFAGVAYIIADVKRETKLDGLAVTFAGQLGELKSAETEHRDRIEKLERVVSGADRDDRDDLHNQVQALVSTVAELAARKKKR